MLYDKLGKTAKIIYMISGLALIGTITFIIVVTLNTQTFAHEGLTKGVITRFSKGSRASSQFQYTFRLDREYLGWTEVYGPLKIGDTIDVIYDRADSSRPYRSGWDDSPPSYSTGSRYYPIIGDYGYNRKYKKYCDKAETSKVSRSKYIGVLP